MRTHKVSVVPGSQGLWSPHWSPDGRYLAAMDSSNQNLTLFDFKTQKWSELARITTAYPNWSRDGNYISSYSFGIDPALYRFSVTTASQAIGRTLLNASDAVSENIELPPITFQRIRVSDHKI